MAQQFLKYLKRCSDEAEYAGVFCHSHIIRRIKLEIFLILHNVIALTLVPLAFYVTYSAAFYPLSERTFKIYTLNIFPLKLPPLYSFSLSLSGFFVRSRVSFLLSPVFNFVKKAPRRFFCSSCRLCFKIFAFTKEEDEKECRNLGRKL